MSDLPERMLIDRAIYEGKLCPHVTFDAVQNEHMDCYLRQSIIAHARTLEKLAQHEPEPVDADEAALVRIIEAWSPRVHRDFDSYRNDKDFPAALAQYKAERPSLSDDEALLIAREITAKFASYFSARVVPNDCRNGLYDHATAFQFTLSMVKRDPAALEAFRGVGRG